MNRRTFIDVVACSLMLSPLLALGQQPERVRRLGFLTTGTLVPQFAAFFDKLRELGWIETRNLIVERRGGGTDLLPALAAELVRINVDLIVTNGAVASLAARNATTTVPIVSITGDPVRAGLVASMSRPGGNVTGISTIAPELAAKRLEVLRELRPTATLIYDLVNPANPYMSAVRKDEERAYRSLGMRPIFVEVADGNRLPGVIAEAASMKADALIIRADPLFTSNRDSIAKLALHHSLPTMAEGQWFVRAGCLASYSVSEVDSHRSMAIMVDKIFKGANPGDLPIEQSTKFDLVINLSIAKALGISIPKSLLSRAETIT